ncbi:phage holin family protein [Methylobacterium symbioticum]|uniref:Phage holin family protein n=1 Tax=Methylobacterium symbioticum TaxID=2584084 RepID=A0A509EB09_9HYPH|nr:phage holin family protein [Methylobacterium symbioticum]VUD71328.1 hypothetical protein MET9862_01906 [Methylobacterium symbioticum]
MARQVREPGSMLALMLAALREAGTLAARTIALARVEIDGNLRALVGLVAACVTIMVLVICAFFVFLDAAVKLLAALIGSEAVAALIVASPFLAIALVLGVIGARRMALKNLEPWRSLRQAKLAAEGHQAP